MERSLPTTPLPQRRLSARIWLVIAYLIFTLYATGQFGALFFSRTAVVGDVTLEALFIHIGFITLYGILTTLPMLMVIGYQRSQLSTLKEKIREDLWLCGLDSKQLSSKMQAFGERNSWSAFILPAVLTMIFLAVMWSFFLMPAGQSGLMISLGSARGSALLNVPAMMQSIADSASVIMVTFLGAYFYILGVLIRRWLQSDMTTGVLWKINVRLSVALLVGFLLSIPDISAAAPAAVESGSIAHNILLIIGFLAGIVPDTVLRWLTQRARQLISPKGENKRGLFMPSDLQEKIDGLNFWQVDRLFEEGIESIQDLAMKEIPDLLIETRFDTPHVLYWVDQALLSNQVGDQGYLFRGAFIRTASDLTDLAERDHLDMEQLLKSIQDGRVGDGSDLSTSVITQPLLENIVAGLRNGPNLPYARAYWANTSSPERRAARLAQLDQLLSTTSETEDQPSLG